MILLPNEAFHCIFKYTNCRNILKCLQFRLQSHLECISTISQGKTDLICILCWKGHVRKHIFLYCWLLFPPVQFALHLWMYIGHNHSCVPRLLFATQMQQVSFFVSQHLVTKVTWTFHAPHCWYYLWGSWIVSTPPNSLQCPLMKIALMCKIF